MREYHANRLCDVFDSDYPHWVSLRERRLHIGVLLREVSDPKRLIRQEK